MRSCKLLSPPWKASVSPQSAHLLIEKCLNIDHLYLKSLIYSYLSENNCPVLSGKPVRQRDGGTGLCRALPPPALRVLGREPRGRVRAFIPTL